MSVVQNNFWLGKRVLITGHSGFKGAWLSHWLLRKGACIAGISLPPSDIPNLFEDLKLRDRLSVHKFIDIRRFEDVKKTIDDFLPEVVFHLAAQALVLPSYENPTETFSTNIMGTVNLLECLHKSSSVKSVVVVTTDKVYDNKNNSHPFVESDSLGGVDPYSASKAACEIVTASYKKSFFDLKGVALSSARAGNVMGGGDWSRERLLPDIVRSWEKHELVSLRMPDATRPWQHVLDPLYGYMQLAEKTFNNMQISGAYNFGPTCSSLSVLEIVNLAKNYYGRGCVKIQPSPNRYEATTLVLDTKKTKNILGISQQWDINTSVQKTMSWYKSYHDGVSPFSLCDEDINSYEMTING